MRPRILPSLPAGVWPLPAMGPPLPARLGIGRNNPRNVPASPRNDATKPRIFPTNPRNGVANPRIFRTNPRNDATNPRDIRTNPWSDATTPRIFPASPRNIPTKLAYYRPKPELYLAKPAENESFERFEPVHAPYQRAQPYRPISAKAAEGWRFGE